MSLIARVTLGALPSSYDVGDKAEGPWGIEVKAFESSALGRPIFKIHDTCIYLSCLLCLYMGARCTCITIEL